MKGNINIDPTINTQSINITDIYSKNKNINNEKINFFRFLMYTTKAEHMIEEFQDLLYWVSIFEGFLFIICILLFIMYPSIFSPFWAFITHAIRSILGFIILKRIPSTHLVIENLNNFEDKSIQEIENQILDNYRTLIANNEGRLKIITIVYFIFTIINIIIDNILFFFLTNQWSKFEVELYNLIGLIVIVAFFCNLLLYYIF
jgi:hypothetical protein